MDRSILEWLLEEKTPESEAMQAGYAVLNQHRLENGRYVLTASKSVPAFKAGNVGEENKWVTLYAYMAQS